MLRLDHYRVSGFDKGRDIALEAIQQREANRDALRRWADRWEPRAEAAAAGLGQLFGQLPAGSRPAETVRDAARAARRRVLAEAGLAEQ